MPADQPVLTPDGVAATEAAWRRGVTLAVEDAQAACRPELDRPFASLEDATLRLLPYHVFSTEEGDEMDLDEAGACRQGRQSALSLSTKKPSLLTHARALPRSWRARRETAGQPGDAVGRHVLAESTGVCAAHGTVRQRLSLSALAVAGWSLVPSAPDARVQVR